MVTYMYSKFSVSDFEATGLSPQQGGRTMCLRWVMQLAFLSNNFLKTFIFIFTYKSLCNYLYRRLGYICLVGIEYKNFPVH
jgi:hypothetical protein